MAFFSLISISVLFHVDCGDELCAKTNLNLILAKCSILTGKELGLCRFDYSSLQELRNSTYSFGIAIKYRLVGMSRNGNDFAWICGLDQNIVHTRFIDNSGAGDVHEVGRQL